MKEEIEIAFEKLMEQKWRDALNIAAAEPMGGDPVLLKLKRQPSSKKIDIAKVASVEVSTGGDRKRGRC
jgi:hypothetical protein